jgi:hypothetical protein
MRGGVFICYRREDTAGFAGRIYDRLKSSLGRESVFIDVDNIPAGRDFFEVLTERVGQCDALVALIGRNWLASADKDNRRRLDDPNDFVRIEIEAALARNVPVIPVLVDGAAVPQANDLPDTLKKLARRQGIEISHNRFDSDAERLTEALAGIEGDTPARPSASPDASAALPLASAKPTARARRLLVTVAALTVIASGVGFVYEYRGAHDETARQEAMAKPTSDVLRILPPPRTTSALNTAAPSTSATEIAAAPPDNARKAAVPSAVAPTNTASNAAALVSDAASDKAAAGKIDESPPVKIGKADASEAPTGPQQWMNVEDFLAYYRGQIDRIYPDKAWGRCQNGVSQRAAHWSPHPAGQHFLLRGTNERTFRTSAAEMTAMGFKMQYDNVFPECDGSTHHQTLWMKEE